MGHDLASGNPTAAPLVIALVLFVALFGGLGFALLRINHVRLVGQNQNHAQKAYVLRRAAYAGVCLIFGITLIIVLGTHEIVPGLIVAAVAVAWTVFGARLLGARTMPRE